MSSVVKKIMGMTLIVPENLKEQELEVDSAIYYANEIYEKVIEENPLIADSNKNRAIAILQIIMELQAIKGNQEVVLDKSTKKVNDLIKKIDAVLSISD